MRFEPLFLGEKLVGLTVRRVARRREVEVARFLDRGNHLTGRTARANCEAYEGCRTVPLFVEKLAPDISIFCQESGQESGVRSVDLEDGLFAPVTQVRHSSPGGVGHGSGEWALVVDH